MNPFWIAWETQQAANAIGLTPMQWSRALFQPEYLVFARVVPCAVGFRVPVTPTVIPTVHPACDGHLLAAILGRN